MNLRKISLLIPFTNNKILMQDRKGIKKPFNKDYGFFGGGIEDWETPEKALKREVFEELGINIKDLQDLKFFKKYDYKNKELNIARELYVFICRLPKIKSEKVKEGKPKIFSFEDAVKQDISDIDKQILKEIFGV